MDSHDRRGSPDDTAPSRRAWRLAALLCVLAGIVSSPAAARAQTCLVGPGATGLEVGSLTASAATPIATPPVDFVPAGCSPAEARVDALGNPALATAGANVFGSQDGLNAGAGAIIFGEAFGSSSASGAGTTKVLFEIVSGPGYAGPTSITLPIRVARFTSQLSSITGGNSSAGGLTTGEVRISEPGAPTDLLASIPGAGEEGTFYDVVTVDRSLEVDTPYVITASLNVSALATAATVGGEIQTATISRSATLTFELDDTDLDPDLSLVFPLVTSLGLPPPQIDPGPAPVPAVAGWGWVVLAAGLGAAARLSLRST